VDVAIRNSCVDYDSYRAQRTKSLFNVDSGADFSRDFHLPIDELVGWTIGVCVGPSGSGKSSIGRALEAEGWEMWDGRHHWPADEPVIDALVPDGDYDEATAALASVGLGDVPSWLRPYAVLSNGERFRADLARVLAERHDRVVVDEFSSVVDRQVAQVGAGAFQKAWRRGNDGSRQAVLLSCHLDILEWVRPNWVLATETGELYLDYRPGDERAKKAYDKYPEVGRLEIRP
jgi:hypothetical protein